MTLARFRHLLLLCGASIVAPTLVVAPANATLIVSNAATKNVACSAGVCEATAKNAVLNAGDLAGMLASSDVTVQSKSKAKDIELRVALSWASASRLTLDSYQSIAFDKPLTVVGPGALTLTTDDGGTGGELTFDSPGRAIFWDLSSSLIIDGASYTLAGDIATLASDIAADPSGHYALANNYDASVDGTYVRSPIFDAFSGTFEGLGNTISNLSIQTSDSQTGLFRQIGGTIEWINITKAAIIRPPGAGGGQEGILAGFSSANIVGVTTSGFITAYQASVGGLVGEFNGTIAKSHSTADVTGDERSGGLAGIAGGTIADSSASGAITGTISGGLVGFNAGTITRSFATGKVISRISQIIAETAAGGLVGINGGGTVDNSYAFGAAVVSRPNLSSSAGGLVGRNASGGQISASYSAGAPSAKSPKDHTTLVGGLIGNDETDGQGLGNTYWDTTTSGIADLSKGAGNIANDPGITGLTSAQLQSGLPLGLDPSLWSEDASINGGLPYLIANAPP